MACAREQSRGGGWPPEMLDVSSGGKAAVLARRDPGKSRRAGAGGPKRNVRHAPPISVSGRTEDWTTVGAVRTVTVIACFDFADTRSGPCVHGKNTTDRRPQRGRMIGRFRRSPCILPRRCRGIRESCGSVAGTARLSGDSRQS